ncbi:golgin subfamily A member 6-like protein 22 [Belonocnema kinseyi]|uniref:golgin subfamily A member 6-like protein 22 n=1 Tax=Belonocnema kinseyi TaxID=2817044 RepID=UPI00143E09F6|nr:golgin subfamily A member 6-like protein 22 [Belonocnema kinseyi]
MKKNIIVKGLKVDNGKAEEEIRKVMRDIGAQVRVEGIRGLKGNKKGRECMLLVNFGSELDKYEVMKKKKLLKGRNERIEEHLTWREIKRKWPIEQKAWTERSKGGREEEGVDTLLEKLEAAIDKIREEVRPREKEEGFRSGWWDDECRESKDRMKESIRKWRKGEMEKQELNRRKREHERMIKEKRQKEIDSDMEEVEKAVKEGREWEVISRGQGGKKDHDWFVVASHKLIPTVNPRINVEENKFGETEAIT